MPKRKRSGKEAAEAAFTEHRAKLYSVLWNVKGHLRQWQSKQLRAAGTSDAKKPNGDAAGKKNGKDVKRDRVEREILVLKSLDLHQAAHAHLVSSLTRFSAIADSPNLPDEIKQGVTKLEVTEEERAALHNVTSALYNRPEVKKAIWSAVEAICATLDVPVPQKKAKEKPKKKEPATKGEKQEPAQEPVRQSVEAAAPKKQAKAKDQKEPKAKVPARTDDDLNDSEQELAVSRFEEMLGGSSDEDDSDEDEEGNDERLAPHAKKSLDPMEISSDEDGDSDVDMEEITKRPGARALKKDLDPMEISSDEEDDAGYDEIELEDEGSSSEEEDSDLEASDSDESEDNDDDGNSDNSDSDAITRSPPRKRKVASGAVGKTKGNESLFLPSLMGGYISGSESASDLDIAPATRKNRRGQKARQAIWEKRYKQEANHVKNGVSAGTGANADTVWDPRRGAVSAKPWKKGVREPLAGAPRREAAREERGPPVRKHDDTGPLHPSWVARKKAKEMEKTAKFEGTKLTFD